MLTILLTRHGQTELNLKGVFRGRLDIPLNKTGVKQAENLAAYLRSKKINYIYSSPMERAVKTSKIISEYNGAEIKVVPELNDLDHGKWEGLPHSTVKEKYPEEFYHWINEPQSGKIPGGESLEDVLKRIESLISTVIATYNNAKVLFISHRAVNRVMMCHLLGLDNSHFWNFEFDNCALTTFTYDNYMKHRFILISHNNGDYLPNL